MGSRVGQGLGERVGEDLAARVVQTIVRAQRLDPARISPESTFAELGFDSLDGITIAFELEEEFNIAIPEEAIRRITTVPELIAGIRELITPP